MPCRSCHHLEAPGCPLGHHRCRQELSPLRVGDAFAALLEW